MANAAKDKTHVFIGIITAWGLSAIFLLGGWTLINRLNWFSHTRYFEILAYTLIWPAISLALGIGWAARTRHFKQNIDGSRPKAGTSLDITLRYIQNTTEQLVLFTLAALCFWAIEPVLSKTVLPVFGVWFSLARMMFWIGYVRSPLSRAVGFASTFHPTLALLGFVLFKLLA